LVFRRGFGDFFIAGGAWADGVREHGDRGRQKSVEDRTTEDQVNDTKIIAGILDGLAGIDKGLVIDVNADVWEGRVLLTGTLDDTRMRARVEQQARTDPRVITVYNEIIIVSKDEKEQRRKDREEEKKGGMQQTASDIWIETKIQGKLLGAKGVTSVNYRWRSVLGNVFVIGRAGSQFEKDLVLENVKTTEGIKSSKNFIEVKSR